MLSCSPHTVQVTSAVLLQLDEHGKIESEKEIDINLAQRDDVLKACAAVVWCCQQTLTQVIPHGNIPVDGVIVHGSTFVDESMLTGESMPLFKHPGDPGSP